MTTRFWIKLYIEILDDAKMGRLPNHLWRRAVELFLLAGRKGNDGALPPVEEMAWTLRLKKDKLLEDLLGLAEIGVVHTCDSTTGTGTCDSTIGTGACTNTAGTGKAEQGKWSVTNFSKRQAAVPVEERVRKSRSDKEPVTDRDKSGNENVTKRYRSSNEAGGGVSTSTSESDSGSDSAEEGRSPAEERGAGVEEPPRTPAEAMVHPDVRGYTAVTGGRIPGLSQYTHVIEAVRFLRKKQGMDERALAEYLKPFWLAWSSRKRQDRRPYDPGNITWLTEWALNGTIPPGSPSQGTSKQAQAEVIRKVARGEK